MGRKADRVSAFYQDAFGDRDVLKGEVFPSHAPDGLPDFEAFRQNVQKVQYHSDRHAA